MSTSRIYCVQTWDLCRSFKSGIYHNVLHPALSLNSKVFKEKQTFYVASFPIMFNSQKVLKLLKKDTPFVWDQQAQNLFKEIKSALTNTPLLRPPNYNKDFLLYLSASDTTIGIILVQIDDQHNEHVMYYLSKGLIGIEFRYAHVEKIAPIAVIAIQRLRHYILL
jgi:hypothetical protein